MRIPIGLKQLNISLQAHPKAHSYVPNSRNPAFGAITFFVPICSKGFAQISTFLFSQAESNIFIGMHKPGLL